MAAAVLCILRCRQRPGSEQPGQHDNTTMSSAAAVTSREETRLAAFQRHDVQHAHPADDGVDAAASRHFFYDAIRIVARPGPSMSKKDKKRPLEATHADGAEADAPAKDKKAKKDKKDKLKNKVCVAARAVRQLSLPASLGHGFRGTGRRRSRAEPMLCQRRCGLVRGFVAFVSGRWPGTHRASFTPSARRSR